MKRIALSFASTATPGRLSLGGDKNGISFRNTSTGFAAGITYAQGSTWFYVTHDGGRTWQGQALPLPPAYRATTYDISPPQFCTPWDGVLVVGIGSILSPLVYVTHDGGRTWTSTTSTTPLRNAVIVSFINVSDGWAIEHDPTAPGGKARLYVTSDGGRHWMTIIPNVRLQWGMLIQFVSRRTGLAFARACVLRGDLTWKRDGTLPSLGPFYAPFSKNADDLGEWRENEDGERTFWATRGNVRHTKDDETAGVKAGDVYTGPLMSLADVLATYAHHPECTFTNGGPGDHGRVRPRHLLFWGARFHRSRPPRVRFRMLGCSPSSDAACPGHYATHRAAAWRWTSCAASWSRKASTMVTPMTWMHSGSGWLHWSIRNGKVRRDGPANKAR